MTSHEEQFMSPGAGRDRRCASPGGPTDELDDACELGEVGNMTGRRGASWRDEGATCCGEEKNCCDCSGDQMFAALNGARGRFDTLLDCAIIIGVATDEAEL